MSPSASVALPPSILSAIGHASEVTPLGHAALEASTITWEDGQVLQRAATAEGSTSTYQPSEFHAEAAWLPTELQRAPADAPAESGDTSGVNDEGGSVLAGASEADVIVLMRAMYPHLRRRLTRDLLLDRERAGHRTDIRY
jgi:hypothetical protein